MRRQDWVQPRANMLACPALLSPQLFHGVFNRCGGVSPAPWDSQNVSFGLGDDHVNVRLNREGIKKALSLTHLVSAGQVHESRVFFVREHPREDIELAGFDALITNVQGLGLLIQQADCQAVMLFDPEKMAVGIAHVGWRGSAADILSGTVAAMAAAFATDPAGLTAAISPSLGPCCAEFVNYRSELPAPLHCYQVAPDYFDFWAVSRDQLTAAGVRPENIHCAEICTCCNREYFSYRRDARTGRFASVIGLRENSAAK